MSKVFHSEPADDLASRLRVLAQDRDTLEVAQVRFIGLVDIQRAYGERWPQQKARVNAVAEDFLRHRIDPANLLVRASEGFVIVFGGPARIDAEVAAGRLVHGLNEFFLGEVDDVPLPLFGVSNQSVPVELLSSALGEAAAVTSGRRPEAAETFGLTQIEWRYQPVWDVKRETLSSWYLAPYIKDTQTRLPVISLRATQPGQSSLPP